MTLEFSKVTKCLYNTAIDIHQVEVLDVRKHLTLNSLKKDWGGGVKERIHI